MDEQKQSGVIQHKARDSKSAQNSSKNKRLFTKYCSLHVKQNRRRPGGLGAPLTKVPSWSPQARQKEFEIVNVSLVVVKVSVAGGVAVLQLLRADHGRADGSVPGPVELAQVDLEAERHLTSTPFFFLVSSSFSFSA